MKTPDHRKFIVEVPVTVEVRPASSAALSDANLAHTVPGLLTVSKNKRAHRTMSFYISNIGTPMARPAGDEALLEALEKCDEYFRACAKAWAVDGGAIVNDAGHIIAEGEGLDELADAAGFAVQQALAAHRKATP